MISQKRAETAQSGCSFNEEKANFNFTYDEHGEMSFKVVSEDYASFLADVELYQKLQRDDLSEIDRKDLLCRKKDFDEMTVLDFIEKKETATLLAKRGSGFNVGINFDGKILRFVAEHDFRLYWSLIS